MANTEKADLYHLNSKLVLELHDCDRRILHSNPAWPLISRIMLARGKDSGQTDTDGVQSVMKPPKRSLHNNKKHATAADNDVNATQQ